VVLAMSLSSSEGPPFTRSITGSSRRMPEHDRADRAQEPQGSCRRGQGLLPDLVATYLTSEQQLLVMELVTLRDAKWLPEGMSVT
jgi:hypothetical protein